MCVEERPVAALLPVRKCRRLGSQLFPSLSPFLSSGCSAGCEVLAGTACGGQGAISPEVASGGISQQWGRGAQPTRGRVILYSVDNANMMVWRTGCS